MPSDPWPTTSYIGWVQASGTWVSRVLHLLHPLLMHLPCSRNCLVRSAVHFWFLMVWVVFRFAILNDLLLLGIWPCWIMGLFHGLVPMLLPYHSTIPVVMLFDSILLGLFGPVVYFPHSDLVCSLGLFLHCLQAPVSHFPLGHPWPICFPWASSALFPILLSYGLLLTLFGLP